MNEFDLRAIGKQVLYSMDELTLKAALLRIEAQVIAEAMRIANGNCDAAAHMLGMNRTTLVEKRRRHGLPLQSLPGFRKTATLGKKTGDSA